MAETTTSAALSVEQWEKKQHIAYVRGNRYARYMGKDQDAIIQIKHDLTKDDGDAITIPLVGAFDDSAGANDGTTDLAGNEKSLPNDGHRVSVGIVRDAFTVKVDEEQKSPIGLREAGKTGLKALQTRYLRNSIEDALSSKNGVSYSAASEAQKDAWLVDNADRCLFGAAKSNNGANDHSAALLNVDATNDTLTPAMVSLAKRMAQTAVTANSDGMRPYTSNEDEETFVMFVPSLAFRDFRGALETSGDLRDAEVRGKANPLWSGPSSLYWDGVIVREMQSLGVLSGVGAAGIDVAPCFLCGAQALAVAWAMTTKSTVRKEDDYGIRHGVGFMEMRGVDKIQYDQTGTAAQDWGVVTVYASGVADV